MNIQELLEIKTKIAMGSAGIPDDYLPNVSTSKQPGWDFQVNGIIKAAKLLKQNPKELALKVIDSIPPKGCISEAQLSGPGFVNLKINAKWLSDNILEILNNEKLGVQQCKDPLVVVVDYSSPNLAKEMHVGHLRSTILGDSVSRVLEFVGHSVVRVNHVGDWGMQFGMLVAEFQERYSEQDDEQLALSDLEEFYIQSKNRFDSDERFADKARRYVVKLQSGDSEIRALWERFRNVSLDHVQKIYDLLNVKLTPDNIQGESAYNDDLPSIIHDLNEKGLLVSSDGALVVFLNEFKNKDGQIVPIIIEKAGGGYLYSTTDLAAIRYRASVLSADRVMYFVDSRQSLHFDQVFLLANKAGFVKPDVLLEHLPFGTILGKDGKPFRTRDGGTVKLNSILNEAIERAEALLIEKESSLSFVERSDVARKVGIGAVKYNDMARSRTNDYVFDWDSMLSFQGNTAPYLQYAYTRVRSIFRKAGIKKYSPPRRIDIKNESEKQLCLRLMQFGSTVEKVAKNALPHLLCDYLHELSSEYMSFYEACPILDEDVSQEARESRLALCECVARTMKTGLDLLGIEVMEQM